MCARRKKQEKVPGDYCPIDTIEKIHAEFLPNFHRVTKKMPKEVNVLAIKAAHI